MGVSYAKSTLIKDLESVLDENEDLIGPQIFKELSKAYERLDNELLEFENKAADLEEDLKKANERIEELENQLEEQEA